MSEKRRVVVTGIGLLCPIGGDDDGTRERLFQGQGTIAKLRSLDATMFRASIGGARSDRATHWPLSRATALDYDPELQRAVEWRRTHPVPQRG